MKSILKIFGNAHLNSLQKGDRGEVCASVTVGALEAVAGRQCLFARCAMGCHIAALLKVLIETCTLIWGVISICSLWHCCMRWGNCVQNPRMANEDKKLHPCLYDHRMHQK